jgi:diketogulonate reductase-like aldo/keto reductase
MQFVTANGAKIPAIGFGTYGMPRLEMLRVIPVALEAGFRHIDTAQIYQNETEVGECLAASSLKREDVFLTTKVWIANYAARDFALSVDESLRKLGTDYIDLLLLHWPSDTTPLAEQIKGLNTAVRKGKVRHIGVSNFNRKLMKKAVKLSDAPIVTNQFEYHPYLNQTALIDECRGLGVSVTAYCGMAVGRVFRDPVLNEIASARGRSVAQIVLRWLVQQEDVIALSRTTNPARVASNLQVFDFALTEAEMATIHDLARAGSRIVSPLGLSPTWDSTPPAWAPPRGGLGALTHLFGSSFNR